MFDAPTYDLLSVGFDHVIDTYISVRVGAYPDHAPRSSHILSAEWEISAPTIQVWRSKNRYEHCSIQELFWNDFAGNRY